MSKHITGHTGLLCLLGSPVAHSVSPEMHNEACDQLGLDYSYLAFDVPEDKMPQAVEGLRTMGARGWNITMPGKNIMCKLADKVSPASEISGACNTIVNDNGVLTAYTTDGVGFMRAVAENGVDIIGKKMTLLGAGGAATAILVQAALDGVAEINVFNVRDNFFGRAEEIVAKLNERTSCKVTLHDFSDPEVLRASIADSAILVNGTSVGMAPKTENTITAYTTDGVGFMRAVAENGVDIIGKKMTLLGAGGAATAILVQAALDGVAEINVFNVRDNFFGRAEEIVAKLNERTSCKVTLHDFSDPEVLRASIADSAILVNGTSVGMAPKTENTIITDTTMFHKDLFVFDVIYNPQETRLLREAKEAGCKTGNGMYMLLYQGAASFKLWTGEDMPVEIIKEKYFSGK